MTRIQTNTPRLTPGNVVFLYGVLRDALGVGKQTFITHVEAALAENRLTADDLGFESTQTLLEALGDSVKLTIFKGGRLYATIIAQPDWDAALDAATRKSEAKPAAKGNKPWKRKKGDKAIKPSCPKRVKRDPEPKTEAESSAVAAVDASADETASTTARADPAIQEAAADASGNDTGSAAGPADAVRTAESSTDSDARNHKLRNVNFSFGNEQDHEEPVDSPIAANLADVPAAGDACGTEAIAETEPEPSIAVTVVYDPYTGIDEETVITPTPGTHIPTQPDVFIGQAAMCPPPAHATQQDLSSSAAEAAAPTKEVSPASDAVSMPQADALAAKSMSQHAPSPATAPVVSQTAPATAPSQRGPIQETETSSGQTSEMQGSAAVRPPLPDDLPVDFSTDVYCPGQQLHQLTLLYPLGADVLGIVGEYFHIACDRGDIEANRRRASFSIRYLDHRERKEALVRITRRAQADSGPLWSISAVEVSEKA